MIKLVHTVLFLTFFAISGLASAATTYEVCNGKDRKIFVARALTTTYQDQTFGTFHTSHKYSRGWTGLDPKQCTKYVIEDANPSFYVYARDSDGNGYFPEEKGTRFCIHFKEAFDNDSSEMVEPLPPKSCKVKNQFGVPFYSIKPGRFTF